MLLRFIMCVLVALCGASFHEQYRVPQTCTDKWESFLYEDKEYVIQNLSINWENAKIMCRGHHNGTLAILDTKEKVEFLAEALAESKFILDSVWVGARRHGDDDPAGYRWGNLLELRRSSDDVQRSGDTDQYPAWQNRTLVPVPESGADCVAVQRISHDHGLFLDLPCHLERPFVCEREPQASHVVRELKTVRCRTGLYRVYDGRLDWHQAAAYCVLRKMSLANIGSMKCLKKLGTTLLKTRPSIESAWVGARGELGEWRWLDSGTNIFAPGNYVDVREDLWPPMRDRASVKQNGCLLLDRHASHDPVFLEARCERKMQFICYQGTGSSELRMGPEAPSDDFYFYVLVRQRLYWQHAYENCHKMRGTLAFPDTGEIMTQLLLLMGENKDEPIEHVWISGRLNMTKDVSTGDVAYGWYDPRNNRQIPDPKNNLTLKGAYMAPWLVEEFTRDYSCLNLDRQDHLKGLVYGLPCDTPQYSICVIEKNPRKLKNEDVPAAPIPNKTPETNMGAKLSEPSREIVKLDILTEAL